MQLLDRVTRWAVPKVPAFQKLYQRFTVAVEAQRETSLAFSTMAQQLRLQKQEAEDRLNAILELRVAEHYCRMPEKVCHEFAESFGGEQAQFKERLWELELALEDRGWVRETSLAELEFSRYGVNQLIRICRIYGIKNPIIKRIAEICELYVFGRGIEINSDDDAANHTIQAFLDANDAEMGHHGMAQKEKDTQTDGALYWGLETTQKGDVRVIMIDPLEIMDVITDPDDTARPWYFLRQWGRNELDEKSGRQTPRQMRCWYPALEYLKLAKSRPKNLGDTPVNWDMPVLRDSGGGSPSKWRWPVPPVYAAVDWARAYQAALEDYATVRRTLARFALMVETKGGPGAIAAYQSLLSTTFADSQGTQIERNPPPVVGSAHIGGPGTAISAFKSAGAQAHPEETRRILLMACASSGMPETFFGDASTGSLATAVSLDRPTELKFTAIQRRWTHTIKMILTYVLEVQGTTSGTTMYEARRNNPAPQPIQIKVKFPTVIEHQIQPMIQAIFEMATLGGRTGIPAGIVDRRTICDLMLAEIGYEDRDTLLDQIYGKNYKPAADVTDQRSQVPAQMLSQPTGKALTDLSIPPPLPPPPAPAPVPGAAPGTSAPKPGAKATKEALLEAVGALREAAGRLNGR